MSPGGLLSAGTGASVLAVGEGAALGGALTPDTTGVGGALLGEEPAQPAASNDSSAAAPTGSLRTSAGLRMMTAGIGGGHVAHRRERQTQVRESMRQIEVQA